MKACGKHHSWETRVPFYLLDSDLLSLMGDSCFKPIYLFRKKIVPSGNNDNNNNNIYKKIVFLSLVNSNF